MALTERRILLLFWVAFLIRGVHHCVQQPLWEGFDEWAHVAYIETAATQWRMPERNETVPEEIAASVRSAPLRGAAALAAEGELLQYEAQQPPLYYVAMAPWYAIAKPLRLETRVRVLRVVSLLMASAAVWFAFQIARLVLTGNLPLLTALLFVCLPGLLVNCARVANDGLAMALNSAVVYAVLRAGKCGLDRGNAVRLGVVLAAALLAKAYNLALLPLLLAPARHKGRFLAVATAVALALGGWWYARCSIETGAVSCEQLDIAASKRGAADRLAAAAAIDWIRVADAAAFTHIWTSGWSFRFARSWMYRVFEFLGGVGIAGALIAILRNRWLLAPMGAAAGAALVQAYHSVTVFQITGQSTALGWYAHSVAASECVLFAAGLHQLAGNRRAPWLLSIVIVLVLGFDVYTAYGVLWRNDASGAPLSYAVAAVGLAVAGLLLAARGCRPGTNVEGASYTR